MSSSERRRAAALLALTLAGCGAAAIRQWDLIDQPLSCAEANRLAYRTVGAMGYEVTAFEPATAADTGSIRARRTQSGEEQAISVAIDCAPSGVTVIASRDGVLVEQRETKRGFHNAFLGVQSNDAAARRHDEAGTAPGGRQRRDLTVLIEPWRGPASKLEFPFDLSVAGVLPVRVEVTNLTGQAYRLVAGEVRLLAADRRHVSAMPVADAAARITATHAGDAPLTALSAAAVADLLRAKLLAGAVIAPGSRHAGFLYFPLADYRSARAVLTDTATGETEGVRVEF